MKINRATSLFLLLLGVGAAVAVAVEPNQWILEGQTLGRGYDPSKYYTSGVVETPDGVTYVFSNFDIPADQNRGRWRLVRIYDRFSSDGTGDVSISYPNGENVWVISDDQRRVHRVEMSEASRDAGAHYPRVVKRVSLAGIDGNGDQAGSLEYLFEYEQASVVRPSGHQADWPPWDGSAQDVALLTGLILPGATASAPVADRERYDFAYYAIYDDGLTHPATTARVYGKLGWVGLPTGGEQAYEYQDYRFPNENRSTPDDCGPFNPGSCNFRPAPTTTSVGVRRKTTWNLDGPSGEWYYQQELTNSGPAPCNLNYQDSRTFVFSPLSKGAGEGWIGTVHYYGQYIHASRATPSGEDWDFGDHGLPFTKAIAKAAGGWEDELYPGEGKLFLSQDTWQCDPQEGGLDPTDFSGLREDLPGLGCKKQQAHFLRYGADRNFGNDNWPPISQRIFDQNRRVTAQRTVTFTNNQPQSKVHTSNRDWDGLGHFRTQVTAGNWNRSGTTFTEATPDQWATRVETTDFNPTTGNVDINHPPIEIPQPLEPWLLNLHQGTSVQEMVTADRNTGAVTTRVERIRTDACFDDNTGALLGTRTRRGVTVANVPAGGPDEPVADPALAGSDLLTLFDIDTATGHLTSEGLFGGDGASLPTSTADACDSGGLEPAFLRRHEYEFGVRKSTWVQDPCGQNDPDVLRTLNRLNIDSRTGLVLRSADTAGLVTEARYDHLGRMKDLTLPGQSHANRTIFQYLRFGGLNPQSPARVVIKQGDLGSPAGTEQQKQVDGFGRLRKEFTLLPDGGRSQRNLTYYAGGPLLQESTVFREGTAGGAPGNTRTDYDALGRPFKITQPDDEMQGQRRQVHIGWVGQRRKTESFWVHDTAGSTHAGGNSNTQRVTVYDPFGRILRVEEPSDPSTTGLEKSDYHYGVGGQLTLVVNPGNRTRRFKRDGAGFLLFEEHPEIQGRVVHRDFNALGLPGMRDHLAGGLVERLEFDYDHIGRLVRTRDGLADRLLSEAIWEPGTGRLLSTKRHNWIPENPSEVGGPDKDVVITKLFSYDPSTGEVIEVRMRSTTGVSFSTRYTFDDLGNLTDIDYPECFTGAECVGVAPDREVSFGYDRGLLAGVWAERRAGGVWSNRAVASPILFHPNGVVASQRFDNQVTWNQEIGPEQIARPNRIFTSGAVGSVGGHSGDWDSGVIEYDLAGNPFKIGTDANSRDEYVYDGVSRLAQAIIKYPVVGGSQEENLSYGYDRHGNLESVLGGPSPITLNIDASTNRLVGYPYDPQGNLLEFGTDTFTYGTLGTVTTLRGLGVNKSYLYDADGERVAVFDYMAEDGTAENWSLRGSDAQVLRQVKKSAAGWEFEKDFIRGSTGLLASIQDNGGANESIRFFHSDHLGTPRLITNRAVPGQVVSYHEYLPYGWELTDPNQDDETMQFTGHERDRNLVDPDPTVADRNDDLDYMHARYYSPWLRRFLSVDSVQGRPGLPQSWNRYAYARNNPIALFDPDGRDPAGIGTGKAIGGPIELSGREYRAGLSSSLFSVEGSVLTALASKLNPKIGSVASLSEPLSSSISSQLFSMMARPSESLLAMLLGLKLAALRQVLRLWRRRKQA